MKCKTEIDFVITWVDGHDPAWLREKAAYSMQETGGGKDVSTVDDRDIRYRDHGLLRYWFRGVDKFAPWVRKIHFVTWGHLPAWLNVEHPKLHIVRHKDYIPSEFLPTFNSLAIEMRLHKIEGLSEHFVYFNDDMFLLSPIRETDFFRDGKPCDMLVLMPLAADPDISIFSHLHLNNSLVLGRYFDKRENMKKQPKAYFNLSYPLSYNLLNLLELPFPKYSGFYTVHGPAPFCKQTFEEVWELESEQLRETLSHRFRCKDDLILYLFRNWQTLSGNFHPQNLEKDFAYFELHEDNTRLYRTIREQKKKFICINDANERVDFDRIRDQLQAAWDTILPERSPFEKAVLEAHQ